VSLLHGSSSVEHDGLSGVQVWPVGSQIWLQQSLPTVHVAPSPVHIGAAHEWFEHDPEQQSPATLQWSPAIPHEGGASICGGASADPEPPASSWWK
jgi:hypothetical protein